MVTRLLCCGWYVVFKEISEILAYPAKIKFVDEIMGDEKENEEFFKVHCVTDDIFQEPPLFSEDVARVVYGGATVTYACIQIAVYMGFKEIYLLGVDCNYCKGSNSNYFFWEQKADVMNHKEDRMGILMESRFIMPPGAECLKCLRE